MNFPTIFPASQYPAVFFGNYYVPNVGKPIRIHIRQPIEWFVLEKDTQNGKALLLSKYVLDWEGYANCPILGHGYETSWDDSYLRLWLNGEFLNDSFSADEQELIIPIYNAASRGNGKRTIDKVFLLSADEVKKYFQTKGSATTVQPMVISLSSGKKEDPVEISNEPAFWWTRTSGSTKDLVICVDDEGDLCEADSNSNEIGVRPAMWVKL